ncbi:uncharacterized protein LOC128213081 isoform X1 [Mya arenaria]|uniref:uncharacterized protein LOC128213081 isoform X1 n=3 Tax=Mya arenaria TaxID=6604 RepID=UPI0022E79BE7|nr:uncharacterized protein LOC128213081 isoform X1 [Mya arenaria]
MDTLGGMAVRREFFTWLALAVVTVVSPELIMMPEMDQYLLTGSNLELNCSFRGEGHYDTTTSEGQGESMTSESLVTDGVSTAPSQNSTPVYNIYNVNKISIRRNNTTIMNGKFHPNESDMTLTLDIYNVSLSDSGMYTCHYNNSSAIHGFKQVIVADIPQAPENLTCLSNNRLDMSCWFTVPDPKHPLFTNWTMQYKFARSREYDGTTKWEDMPASQCSASNLSCSWSSNRERRTSWTFNKIAAYCFIRVVRHSFVGTVNSTVWQIYVKGIVKPSPVRDLRYMLTDINTTLVLRWIFPKNLSPYLIGEAEYSICLNASEFHNVTCQIYRPDFRLLYLNETNLEENYTFPDVIPHCNYTASVRMRSVNATSDLYWSDPVVLEFISHDSVPTLAPMVTGASYQHNFTTAQTYSLIIYWKNPPQQTWGGEITSYKVVVMAIKASVTRHPRQLGKDMMQKYTETFRGVRSHAKLNTPMNTAEDYRVHVIMINTVGDSPMSDSVNVSSTVEGNRPRASWVSVQPCSDGTIVSWSAGHQNCEDIASVTYYWCNISEAISDNRLSNCLNLDWYTVSADGECNGSMVLNRTSDQSSVRYAVSLTARSGRNGGMVWDLYRFSSYDKEPDPPVYKVSRKEETVTMEMIIMQVPSVNQGGQPSQYQIVYAPVKSPGDRSCPTDGETMTVPADLSSNMYRIPGVQSGVQYSVCARGVNHAGIGAYGEPDVIQKLEEQGGSNELLALGLGLGAAIVLAIVGIVMVRRYCRKCIQMRQEVADMIDMNLHVEGLINRNGEGDSGCGTSSEQSLAKDNNGSGCPKGRSSGSMTEYEELNMTSSGESMTNGPYDSVVQNGENGDQATNSSTKRLAVQETNEKPVGAVDGFVKKGAEGSYVGHKEIEKLTDQRSVPEDNMKHFRQPADTTDDYVQDESGSSKYCRATAGSLGRWGNSNFLSDKSSPGSELQHADPPSFTLENIKLPTLMSLEWPDDDEIDIERLNSFDNSSLRRSVPTDNMDHFRQPVDETDDYVQDESGSSEYCRATAGSLGRWGNSISFIDKFFSRSESQHTDPPNFTLENIKLPTLMSVEWPDDDEIDNSFYNSSLRRSVLEDNMEHFSQPEDKTDHYVEDESGLTEYCRATAGSSGRSGNSISFIDKFSSRSESQPTDPPNVTLENINLATLMSVEWPDDDEIDNSFEYSPLRRSMPTDNMEHFRQPVGETDHYVKYESGSTEHIQGGTHSITSRNTAKSSGGSVNSYVQAFVSCSDEITHL